jgi:hypothetical protein
VFIAPRRGVYADRGQLVSEGRRMVVCVMRMDTMRSEELFEVGLRSPGLEEAGRLVWWRSSGNKTRRKSGFGADTATCRRPGGRWLERVPQPITASLRPSDASFSAPRPRRSLRPSTDQAPPLCDLVSNWSLLASEHTRGTWSMLLWGLGLTIICSPARLGKA